MYRRNSVFDMFWKPLKYLWIHFCHLPKEILKKAVGLTGLHFVKKSVTFLFRLYIQMCVRRAKPPDMRICIYTFWILLLVMILVMVLVLVALDFPVESPTDCPADFSKQKISPCLLLTGGVTYFPCSPSTRWLTSYFSSILPGT